MAREPCESEMVPSFGKRGSSVENLNLRRSWYPAGIGAKFVCAGLLIYHPNQCAICVGGHPLVTVKGPLAQLSPRLGRVSTICLPEGHADDGH